MSFTFLDIGLLVVFAVFLIRGLLCGLIQELAGLLGIVFGFFAASRFQHEVVPYVARFVGNREWAEIVAYAVIFIVVFLAVVAVGMIVRKPLKGGLVSWLDYLAGAVLGAAKGAIICTIIFLVIKALMPQADFVRDSVLAPYLDGIAMILKPYLPFLP